MKNTLLLLLLTFYITNSFAQQNFEKGYYLDNEGNRIEGLIKQENWVNNPSQFYFTIADTIPATTIKITDAQEFGIVNQLKYQRFTLAADVKIKNQANLDFKKSLDPKVQTLFLRVILVGEATLFIYEKDAAEYFFYSLKEAIPEQLVYKRYAPTVDQIKTNNQYRQQIWNNLTCTAWSPVKLTKLKYKQSDLVKIFTQYNQRCGNGGIFTYVKKPRKAFRLSLRPRWNSGFLSIERQKQSEVIVDRIKQSSKPAVQLGLELEYVLSINQERWSIFIEPTYVSYEGTLTGKVIFPVDFLGRTYFIIRDGKYISTYRVLELPIGFRYHLPIKDKFKLFVNAAYAFEIPFEQKVVSELKGGIGSADLELNSEHITYFGGGINYNHKFSLEFRYGLKRELVNKRGTWKTYFNSFSIIAGYNFL
ncbi:MAG: hypothetical protein AB8G15_12050 [Saprospiraceae bacterium]